MQFSPATIERFQRARYKGLKFKPDAIGIGGSFESGRFIILGLRCRDSIIEEARYESFNCLSAIAAIDWICERIEGATAAQASEIETQTIVDALGGLPTRRRLSASLAHDALTIALQEARKRGIL